MYFVNKCLRNQNSKECRAAKSIAYWWEITIKTLGLVQYYRRGKFHI